MKKLFFATTVITVMSIASITSTAAVSFSGNTVIEILKRDVPPPIVVASFNFIFGNVPVMQWKARSNGQWRAHFLRNGVRWEATFTSTGVLVKSERA